MELDNRDFLNTPPVKTVRFGGTVADTLAKYKKGDLSDYELLRHQLADPDIKHLPWVGRSQAVVEEYLAFLSNLVSAQTVYLCSCLGMVVAHFIPKRVTVSEGGVDFSDSDDEDENLPRNFEQCHRALQLISRYVPSTSRFLTPILHEKFPFIQKSSRTLECYVHNLLRVSVYLPSMRRDVLEIIIDKMLQLDVTASRSDIEEAEERAVHQQPEEALFDMALSEAFLEHLWRLVQNPSQAAVLRQAALGYMGSFLARAKFIPIVTVRACLDLMVSWIHSYLDSQDCVDKQYCDLDLHGPFYSACQAVFYTLVFRHRAMLEGNMKRGLEYLQSLNLERIVMCQLNPLKVCLPMVTYMFAAIMRRYQVVFCYTVIERNSRHMLPVVRSSTGGDRVTPNTNPLDSFFPFDPYLLKRSGQLIQPLYQAWEEPTNSELHASTATHQGSREDEDDFLSGETPKTEGIVGMTPSSYESAAQSPSSVGSPPFTFHRGL